MGPTELVRTSDCKVYAELAVYAQVRYGVGCIHSLDWSTGMEHWTGLLDCIISFFGQVSVYILQHFYRLSTFTGLGYWTGILDWTIGLSYFPFLDKFLYLAILKEAHIFHNKQVDGYYG